MRGTLSSAYDISCFLAPARRSGCSGCVGNWVAVLMGGFDNRWVAVTYVWRGDFTNVAVSALHAEGFGGRAGDVDWQARVQQHSLGWVCAWRGGALIGFVNVAWDGGVHAFILDTVVATVLTPIFNGMIAAANSGD